MIKKTFSSSSVVCIIGLGYVGLPLARAFAKRLKVIGLDINQKKVKALRAENTIPGLEFTDKVAAIAKADFNIICVPTPVNENKEPDLTAIKNAASIIGRNMKKGSIAILESTVYPGVTEEVLQPILESESGYICGKDFYIGYSPERINPGDDEHSVEKVTKVVAGMNQEITDIIADLYQHVTPKVFKARNIKTAEAAKIAENIQRDLNIALTNELALIFQKIGINSSDVFDAAATKWNYHRYKPGMVGGYCIPVVPYYLVHKSRELGYNPEVILAGRNTNNSMPFQLAQTTADAMKSCKKRLNTTRVLVMGLTYKENVAESRESPVKDLINALKAKKIDVFAYDPYLGEEMIKNDFNTEPVKDLKVFKKNKFDAVIITVPHAPFLEVGLDDLKEIQNANPVLVDIPGIFKDKNPGGAGFCYRTL
jgi:UDP-N-acetyl-D-glucosamine/UDP-N-acetyl-D-galactosamine dehydrogenase